MFYPDLMITGYNFSIIVKLIKFNNPLASYLSLTLSSIIIKQLAWYGFAPNTKKSYTSAIDLFKSCCII